ncbi:MULTISPECIES: CHAD domain-containing protein [unclassified Pseudomonas]|uniref:CHAD domain-containing protein n=1 Tax=unclassified Pseudomonas TaxID=196821 RepID=UPI001199F608|nr:MULTISPECIES: CHAD domain-containing protein [unclassified Pseudomonas]TWC18906.1 CHAD domain-containing protein [Pseudomonas sp. SJZ075]TWC21873.1 CHAD domain-containing protein [Pseudomonas sp. SJZ074]TWC33342.1 CHAD domain-containing protein [Pseudomonas sp. SJZ078]TWC39252.1 CHAD domain-containing protein [Pseudomonas sp. SJZ085]TWC55900.1 CHAD domain-containing protein [Pseudomonas sp. SJZ124]
MIDRLVARILGLEVRLLACQARLSAHTDSEALHDLRTTVRRLRSLLRPLRGLPGVEQLETAASAVGTLTTPLRDREVLAAYLEQHGKTDAAQRRRLQMAEAYPAVAASREVTQLLMILDAFPRFIRAAQRQGLLKGLRKRIEKRLNKQWKKLGEALRDPAHDRHRLRLLIKRVRYAIEAYPELDRLPEAAMPRLKSAQGALGDWHDCWQWLARAEQEQDLQPCVPVWRTTMTQAEAKADKVLDKLIASCFEKS